MKFEVLKRSHLKRNIIIGIVVIVILSAIVFIFTSAKIKNTQSIPLANGTINYSLADLNIVAIIVDGEEMVEVEVLLILMVFVRFMYIKKQLHLILIQIQVGLVRL